MLQMIMMLLLTLPVFAWAEAEPQSDPAAAVIPLPAYAAPEWASLAGAVDRDGDGQVSKQELEAIPTTLIRHVDRDFKRLDGNQDGALTEAEYQAFVISQELGVMRRFKGADKDASGGLSREEATQAIGVGFQFILNYFSLMDADQNGEVTWEERVIFLSKPESLEPPPAPPTVTPSVPAAAAEIQSNPQTQGD